MEKSIENYKHQIKMLRFGINILTIGLILVGFFSYAMDRDYRKQIDFYKDNNTIKVSSYYLGLEDGERQGLDNCVLSFIEAIHKGSVVYYLAEDNKTIKTINLSSCEGR